MTLPNASLIAELENLLRNLDEAAADEDAQELNATFEDVLLLLDEIDPEEPDDEELADARAELDDLCAGYARIPGLFPYAERLKDLLKRWV